MATEGEKDSGAEEFVAVEIELAAPLNPEQEKNLRAALGEIDPRAFDSCDIAPEKISSATTRPGLRRPTCSSDPSNGCPFGKSHDRKVAADLRRDPSCAMLRLGMRIRASVQAQV